MIIHTNQTATMKIVVYICLLCLIISLSPTTPERKRLNDLQGTYNDKREIVALIEKAEHMRKSTKAFLDLFESILKSKNQIITSVEQDNLNIVSNVLVANGPLKRYIEKLELLLQVPNDFRAWSYQNRLNYVERKMSSTDYMDEKRREQVRSNPISAFKEHVRSAGIDVNW
jgi:hypothetical protein